MSLDRIDDELTKSINISICNYMHVRMLCIKNT